MSQDIHHDIDRRTVLKGTGGALGASIAGLGGLALFGGGAAASATTSFDAVDPTAVTTDDGSLQYVGFGGLLRFEWDGLDSEATHGQYEVETRINTGGGYGGWNSHGTQSGPLGDEAGAGNHDGDGQFEGGEENTPNSWGGPNDTNSGTGTDGFFEFRYGSPYGQDDYALAADGDYPNLIGEGQAPYGVDAFDAESDGGTQQTNVEFRMTCAVFDGDPENGGSKLIEDASRTTMTVTVNNRAATGSTGGEVEGTVGADES